MARLGVPTKPGAEAAGLSEVVVPPLLATEATGRLALPSQVVRGVAARQGLMVEAQGQMVAQMVEREVSEETASRLVTALVVVVLATLVVLVDQLVERRAVPEQAVF